MHIALDLYQTVALAGIVYLLGAFIRSRVSFFNKYCIPAPVIGGLIFAIFTLILNIANVVTIETDSTMQDIFMTLFFTSVGYTASLKLLKKGGKDVILFTFVCAILIVLQDVLGMVFALLFDLDPLLGLCVGSIPMVGGHGTAGSFGPLLENSLGIKGATTISVAAATFGLIAGGLIGGPIARTRINRRKLKSTDEESNFIEESPEDVKINLMDPKLMLQAFAMLFLAAGIGSFISDLIELSGLTFPSYIGAMIAAAAMRNLTDATKRVIVMEEIISVLGSVCLTLFLTMALMSLRLWELAGLAGPLIVMLLGEALLTAAFAFFVVFNVMGRNYDAAIMASATCGFGMGATPNAIANMQSLTTVYGPSAKAFFIVPLVGSLFIDFINSGILTTIINVIK